MADTCFFESQGIPCVALISSEFKGQAVYQAGQLGMSNAVRLFVPHPISDCTRAQLEEKADAVIDRAIYSITHNDLALMQAEEDKGAWLGDKTNKSIQMSDNKQDDDDCAE